MSTALLEEHTKKLTSLYQCLYRPYTSFAAKYFFITSRAVTFCCHNTLLQFLLYHMLHSHPGLACVYICTRLNCHFGREFVDDYDKLEFEGLKCDLLLIDNEISRTLDILIEDLNKE